MTRIVRYSDPECPCPGMCPTHRADRFVKWATRVAVAFASVGVAWIVLSVVGSWVAS